MLTSTPWTRVGMWCGPGSWKPALFLAWLRLSMAAAAAEAWWLCGFTAHCSSLRWRWLRNYLSSIPPPICPAATSVPTICWHSKHTQICSNAHEPSGCYVTPRCDSERSETEFKLLIVRREGATELLIRPLKEEKRELYFRRTCLSYYTPHPLFLEEDDTQQQLSEQPWKATFPLEFPQRCGFSRICCFLRCEETELPVDFCCCCCCCYCCWNWNWTNVLMVSQFTFSGPV